MSDLKKVFFSLIFFTGGAVIYEILDGEEEEEQQQQQNDIETEKREMEDYNRYLQEKEEEKVLIKIDEPKLIDKERDKILDVIEIGGFILAGTGVVIVTGYTIYRISINYFEYYQILLRILQKLKALAVWPFQKLVAAIRRLVEYIRGVKKNLPDNMQPDMKELDIELLKIAEKIMKTPPEQTRPPTGYEPFLSGKEEIVIPVAPPIEIKEPSTKTRNLLFGAEEIFTEDTEKKISVRNELNELTVVTEKNFKEKISQLMKEDTKVRIKTPENVIVANQNNENISVQENIPPQEAFVATAPIQQYQRVRPISNEEEIIENYNRALTNSIVNIFGDLGALGNILRTVISLENRESWYVAPSNPHIYIGQLKGQTPKSYFTNIIISYEKVLQLLAAQKKEAKTKITEKNIQERINKIERFIVDIKAYKEAFFPNI